MSASALSAKRDPPQQVHYYSLSGGSRSVNLQFTPAAKPTRQLAPNRRTLTGAEPLRSCVPGSRVLADGTILPPREPSRLAQAASAKRAATADMLASTATPWDAAPTTDSLTASRSSGHFSTEHGRSFAPPVRPAHLCLKSASTHRHPCSPRQCKVNQHWVGMTKEQWAKDDGCIYKSSPMVCRDNCACSSLPPEPPRAAPSRSPALASATDFDAIT